MTRRNLGKDSETPCGEIYTPVASSVLSPLEETHDHDMFRSQGKYHSYRCFRGKCVVTQSDCSCFCLELLHRQSLSLHVHPPFALFDLISLLNVRFCISYICRRCLRIWEGLLHVYAMSARRASWLDIIYEIFAQALS